MYIGLPRFHRLPRKPFNPDPRSLSLPIASLLHTNSTLVDRANRNTKQKKGGKKPFPVSFSARPPPESMEIRAPPTSLRLAAPPASASFRRTALRTSFLNGSGAFPEFVSYPASPSYPCSRERLLHEFFFVVANSISALHCSFGSLEHAWSVDGSYTSQWQT